MNTVDRSENLALPYILPGQAQKHVTHNEAIRILDTTVQIGITAQDLTSPPSNPQPGSRYIVGAPSTGSWAGHEDAIAAFQDGAWTFVAPQPGWLAWIIPEEALYAWNGSTWGPVAGNQGGSASGTNPVALVGINTLADTSNRLAVKSDAVLFSHDDVTPGSGSVRQTLNKAAPADTASVVFQTGYSGRAEFGLTGDDHFRLKVSPDGTTWTDALVIAPDTGWLGLGTSAPVSSLHVVSEDAGITLESAASPGTTWSIGVGRPGLFDNELIISTNPDIDDFSSHQLRIPLNGAPNFSNGVAVTDGKHIGSHSSIALAYYRPYDGQLGELSFRGPNDTGSARFRIRGWYHDGNFNRVDVGAWFADSNGARMGIGTLTPATTLDVAGPVRVGTASLATLPDPTTNGAGSIIYVSDESGGSTLAFSDGSDWRRVQDRAIVS